MNLYIFNESTRAAVFGIGTYISELTSALKKSAINMWVVHLSSNKPNVQTEEMDGIQHWFFPAIMPELKTMNYVKQTEMYYRNVVYLLRLHIKDNRDLVFHLNYNQSDKLAEGLKKVFDCRIITVTHYYSWIHAVFDNLPRLRTILKEEQPTGSFGERLKKTFEDEKSFYSKVDQIVCPSNYMREILCLDYGIDILKTAVIPNGLTDMSVGIKSKLLRKKWNISEREKIILFAGRMDQVKGIDFLIKAFREVLSQYPRCRLVIAGNGAYDKCTKESREICANVIYTGFLNKIQLNEWYRLADIGVIPSLFESFGYVALEMMMHGLPIVATATSGLNEVVDDTCGLKTPVTALSDSVEIDTTLLSQKILYLLQHPAEARKLGRNGRKKYLKEFSLKLFRQNMITFYTT